MVGFSDTPEDSGRLDDRLLQNGAVVLYRRDAVSQFPTRLGATGISNAFRGKSIEPGPLVRASRYSDLTRCGPLQNESRAQFGADTGGTSSVIRPRPAL